MAKPYVRKTRDEYQIHVWYGSLYGWEYEIAEDTYREARLQRDCYRENQPEYPVKIVKRRIKING